MVKINYNHFEGVYNDKIISLWISEYLDEKEIKTTLESKGYVFDLEEVIKVFFTNEKNEGPIESISMFVECLDSNNLSEEDQKLYKLIQDDKNCKYWFKVLDKDTNKVYLYDYYAIYKDFFLNSDHWCNEKYIDEIEDLEGL